MIFAFIYGILLLADVSIFSIHFDRKYRKTKETDSHERHQRAVVEEQGNFDNVMQLLNGKCVDRAPNCNQELCKKYNISLWKKCKKTCGDCNPMVKMATRNPKEKKLMVNH